MISKSIERAKAIELRKKGLSYNEIRSIISVSKSSLSLWLRNVGLAKSQKQALSEKQKLSQKKAVRMWHETRVEKSLLIKKDASNEIPEISIHELWLIGIALYWAEGSKEKDRGSRVIFCNSDPMMVVVYKKWLSECLKINTSDLIYSLYIHETALNPDSAREYWANYLDIEPHELSIVYKKNKFPPKRKNVGVKYRGLVRIAVRNSTDLNRRISGWTEGLHASIKNIGD